MRRYFTPISSAVRVLTCLAGLFYILLIGSQPGVAQGLPFNNFSIQSGMSQSVINDIIQDQQGYMWIATEFGLNRFNMFQFDQFYEANGLSHNGVTALLQRRDGTLLAGTESGLDYLLNGRFHPVPGTRILNGEPVSVIFEDSSGGLWVGTNGSGLYYFTDDSFQYFAMSNGLSDDVIRGVIELDGQRIAVATRNGVTILSFATRSIERIYTEADGLSENRTRDIKRRADGSIWVATRDGITILENGSVRYLGVRQGLIHPRVNRLLDDGRGGVWIATEGGISHYSNGRLSNYTDTNGLANNIVTALARDHENNVRFGTYGGGVDLLVSEKILHYSVEQGMLSNLATSFAQDASGTIWVGTYGGGISQLNGNRVVNFTTAQNLIDNRVYTLTRDRQNRLWIGTRNGVSLMENGRIFPGNQFTDLPDPKVRSILIDRRGDFWIATYGGGIARYRGGQQVQVYNTTNGMPNDIVMNLIEDRDGAVWAATYGGVVRFIDNRMDIYTTDNGLVNNNVISLFEDGIGQVWMGTMGGVSVFAGGQLRSLTTRDGLPQPVAYFITEDDEANIWIGSNNGLIRYNTTILEDVTDPDRVRDQVRFKLYTTEMGLISNENNSNAVMRDRDGSFWIGTIGGVNHFRWQLDREVAAGPPIHIEGMTLFGERIPVLDYEFRHDENFIGFTFTGISFSNPSGVIYEYRLRGIDQNWQRTTQRTVRYTTLPDGEYRFEVRARNSDGFWSPHRATITFTIQPPFWKTWWFVVLIIIAVMLVVGFLYNYYRIAKLVDLERIRIRIASDLHDDVGASLTELALQADFLQAIQKDPKMGVSLKQMGEMSRKIVTTMDDIVWSIDARNDTFGDLLDRMQDYATNVLIPNNIEPVFHFSGVDSDKVLPLDLRQNLYLIYKEAINNAAKHSGASIVEITFDIKPVRFTLEIKDNGKGFPDKTRSGGHGLKNMKMRAERIKASLDYITDNGLTIRIIGKGL